MLLNIPDDYLIAYCGGYHGDTTSVSLRAVVKNYLYSDQSAVPDRKAMLGQRLVDILESQLSD